MHAMYQIRYFETQSESNMTNNMIMSQTQKNTNIYKIFK